MNDQNEKIALLGSASIPKALLKMGVPNMLGMLVNALYNLADAYFVSGLGESQLGAISVTYPLGQAVTGLGLLFGNGAASYLSRLLGRGEREHANQVASTALYGGMFTGAVLILLSLLFLNPLLGLMGATRSILPYASAYARIFVGSCILNVFNVMMNSIVTSEGAAKTTLGALLAGAALNMALDPLMIHGLGLGVSGAAIATAASQLVSTGIYLAYIRRGKSLFRFRLKDCAYTQENMSEIFKIGIPTLVFQLLTTLSISLVNNAAGAYGDSAIAAMGVVTRVISMGSLSVFGFIKGFQPIAGYSYGAGRFERLHQAIRISLLWSTAFCVVFGGTLALVPREILSFFSADDAEILRIGSAALRANGITMMLFGFYTVYSALFLALGKGGAGLFLGACRQGVCFLPAILLLPRLWGLSGLVYVQPAADVLSALLAGCMAIPLHKMLRDRGAAFPNGTNGKKEPERYKRA